MTRAIWFGGSVLAAIGFLILGLALRKPCDPPRLVGERYLSEVVPWRDPYLDSLGGMS